MTPPSHGLRALSVARKVGRYEIHARIASGGMASVHLGRLVGPAGFSRVVAVKRLHEHYAQDPNFVRMFLDEARIAARIRHPNVVATLDVVVEEGELFLVMEYIEGESLAALIHGTMERGERIAIPIVQAIFINVLEGLDAAHEATDEAGRPLGIIHRDVSPQNIIVGTDGVARVLDFGVAKAVGRYHDTKSGAAKGKVAYMAPEQVLARGPLTRAVDLYATSVVLWETLVGRRYLEGLSNAQMLHAIAYESVLSPSRAVPDIPPALDAIVMRGGERAMSARFATARDMAFALTNVGHMATPMQIAGWVKTIAGEALAWRAACVGAMAGSANPQPAHDGPAALREVGGSATVDVALWTQQAADVFASGAARARELDGDAAKAMTYPGGEARGAERSEPTAPGGARGAVPLERELEDRTAVDVDRADIDDKTTVDLNRADIDDQTTIDLDSAEILDATPVDIGVLPGAADPDSLEVTRTSVIHAGAPAPAHATLVTVPSEARGAERSEPSDPGGARGGVPLERDAIVRYVLAAAAGVAFALVVIALAVSLWVLARSHPKPTPTAMPAAPAPVQSSTADEEERVPAAPSAAPATIDVDDLPSARSPVSAPAPAARPPASHAKSPAIPANPY
jgi:serine/threonine-protein kinase